MSEQKEPTSVRPLSWLTRVILKVIYFAIGIGICGAICITLIVMLVWPNLPDLKAMTDYRPRLPLRIYSADKNLMAEYGEERRNVLHINEFPDTMKHAILAAEDDNFYHHGGVDWSGVGRAVLANVSSGGKAQGASTITMQVARNFYLTSEKSFLRKFYELLLTYKIEQKLTKDQILELYMNQIYLGYHSYGFAAAAHTYFGKPVSELTIGEAAILAGIPKAPSAYNPRRNIKRATARQHYVLGRMLELGYIDQAQYDEAMKEPIQVARSNPEDDDSDKKYNLHGAYVAELARQLMYTIYKDDVYARGLNVYTTINSRDQYQAYKAVRSAVLTYTRNHPYPGPAGSVDLPDGVENDEDKMGGIIDEVHNKYADSDEILSAVVLSASDSKVVVMRDIGQVYELTGDELKNAKRSLGSKVPADKRIQRGSVVYIEPHKMKDKTGWSIINLPSVEGALVALDPTDGAIKSLVGGFDFRHGLFNRVTQAWRQSGSTFKPFVYAAALERGVTPETNVSDQQFVLSSKQTGGKPWTPKNYGNRYYDSRTMRQGLYQSRNMVSIRVTEAAGPEFEQEFVSRFGFDMSKQPPKGAYLTMALGAGNVTLLQMASGYGVFANGGYLINPYLIDRVEDTSGELIMKAQPQKAGDEKLRVIDPRTAYVMNDLLHGVATSGTAARTTRILGRSDLHGKTGTTNKSMDAWFVGYTPKLVGVTWMGYDQPTTLGSRATGGGLSMPIWIDYMKTALKDVPVVKPPKMPDGLTKEGNNFFYKEYPKGKAILNLGTGGSATGSSGSGSSAPQPASPTQQNNPVGNAIDNFNPLGGPPIRF